MHQQYSQTLALSALPPHSTNSTTICSDEQPLRYNSLIIKDSDATDWVVALMWQKVDRLQLVTHAMHFIQLKDTTLYPIAQRITTRSARSSMGQSNGTAAHNRADKTRGRLRHITALHAVIVSDLLASSATQNSCGSHLPEFPSL